MLLEYGLVHCSYYHNYSHSLSLPVVCMIELVVDSLRGLFYNLFPFSQPLVSYLFFHGVSSIIILILVQHIFYSNC